MQPSSLVFLVLIAIWAAYLLQHWVRRREHLATARSVDRFSDAMHVLERRVPLPEFDLSMPRPRSYAVSPARPSRPEVVVKRAQSPTPDVSTTPSASTRPAAAVRSTQVFHVPAGVSARRVRGLSLVASLLLTVVVSPLAAFSVLPWWSVLVAVVVLVADVAWLRHVAVSERVTGRAKALARGSAAEPESESESESVVAASAAEAAEPTEFPAEADLSGWAPIPVPPPTYTLKAMAAPPVPLTVPAAVNETGSAQSSSLDGLVYDCELDELVERRRIVGG